MPQFLKDNTQRFVQHIGFLRQHNAVSLLQGKFPEEWKGIDEKTNQNDQAVPSDLDPCVRRVSEDVFGGVIPSVINGSGFELNQLNEVAGRLNNAQMVAYCFEEDGGCLVMEKTDGFKLTWMEKVDERLEARKSMTVDDPMEFAVCSIQEMPVVGVGKNNPPVLCLYCLGGSLNFLVNGQQPLELKSICFL